MAPSVCSQNTFPPPEPNSSTVALAELAALTVRLFPPKAIAAISQTFSSNPHLVLSEHLPILGNLVVRHVALCLCDEDGSKSSTPQKVKRTPPNRRIPPYRSLAYAAVRSNRIIPESIPLSPTQAAHLSNSPDSTVCTRPPARRLSITVPKRSSEGMRHTVSQPCFPLREMQVGSSETEMRVEDVLGMEKLDMGMTENEESKVVENVHEENNIKRTATPIGAVRRRRCSGRHEGDEVFPRATASAVIKSESCRRLRLEDESRAQSSSSIRMGSTGSKLVQLRRQRSERRSRGVR